jgi:hypothetical protein
MLNFKEKTMPVTTNIEQPRAFDRATVGLLAGGLAAGGVTAVLATVFNASTAGLGALAFGVVVGLVTYLIDDTEDDALIGLLLSIGGGVTLAAGLGAGAAATGWIATGIGGALIGLGAGARRFEGRKRLIWAAVSAAALVAARFTTLELLSPERFAALDSMALLQVLSSGIWGLFLAGAVGTGFVRLDRDEVLAKLDRAIAESMSPVDDYLRSATELYEKINGELERGHGTELGERARAITEETIDSLTEFSLRYTELREGISEDKARALRRRAETLDKRIEQARSPELAAQLRKTQDEVLGQLDIQEELELACARLESRGQRCVTMLERLHVTLVQNASGELQNAALNESFEELEHLADEVQMKSLSVEQLLAAAGDGERADAEAETQRDGLVAEQDAKSEETGADDGLDDDGVDGTLDDGTDGATVDDTDCEASERAPDAEGSSADEEQADVVEAIHQSC